MKQLLFASLFLPMFACAQVLTGFNEGYILTNNNDTLYGLLKLRNKIPYKIFPRIQFKKTAEAEVESFAPAEVKGFTMGMEIYESKYVSAKKTEKVFFQLKIKGYLSYYENESYAGPNTGSFYTVFLQKENAEDFFVYQENNPFFPFKRKLSEYLKDYPELASKVRHYKYNQTHIVRIVNEYNEYMAAKQLQQ